MFNAVETQINLLDVAANARSRCLESFGKLIFRLTQIFLRGHFTAHHGDFVRHSFDRAGDITNQIVVGFTHYSNVSSSRKLKILQCHAAAMSASLISKLAETFCTSS